MTEETLERTAAPRTAESRSPDMPVDGGTPQSTGVDPSTDKQPPSQPTPSATENASVPEFNQLKRKPAPGGVSSDLKRLHEVQVTVAAELGRTKVPIQELLKLTEGSVFELNRNITSPVELLAQGVPLGNGEVVVVDDQFAIRILEIYART